MGKSARLREERRQQRTEELALMEEQAAKRRKWLWLRITIISVISVMAAVAIVAGVFFGIIAPSASYQRKTVVMESENFKIDGMMMAYYMMMSYQTTSEELGDLGIDTSVSFKKQYFGGTTSYFDYFRAEAQYEMNQVLLFAEKAKEDGIELTEEEKASLRTQISATDISGYTEWFGLTVDDMVRAVELTELASKALQAYVDSMGLTDEEIKTYFDEHEGTFHTLSYKMYQLPYGENGWFPDAATAKSAAEVFKKTTDASEFDSCMTQLVLTLGGTEENAKQEITDGTYTDVNLTEENAFFNWVFDETHKVSDIFIEDTGSAYCVYMLTTLPQLPTVEMHDVRHILFDATTYGDDATAKAKAEEVLAEWKNGAATAESFGELAREYSADTGSKEVGGLIENVYEGQMVEPFETWLFDDGRKVGDAEIVKTDYGYHVMYYVGEGDEYWQVAAENRLSSEKLDAWCTEYAKTHTITIHDSRMKRIPL